MLSFRRRAGAGLGASGGDALEKVAAKQAQFEKRGRNMKFASYKSTISYGVAQAYWGFFSLLGYTDSFNDVMLAHARLVTFRMGSELSKIASETAGALGANTNPQDGMSPSLASPSSPDASPRRKTQSPSASPRRMSLQATGGKMLSTKKHEGKQEPIATYFLPRISGGNHYTVSPHAGNTCVCVCGDGSVLELKLHNAVHTELPPPTPRQAPRPGG